jgi:hypothetical protein
LDASFRLSSPNNEQGQELFPGSQDFPAGDYPTNSTVAAGQSVSFFAAASANPIPTVQWQISTNGGSTFFNIFGATSTTYTFTTSSAMNGYKYRAVFSNSLGTATTASARLTV